MSGHEFHVIWDVSADANMFQLVAEAEATFRTMAVDAGVVLTGPVRYSRERPDRFTAVAAAERDPHAGQRPPWEDPADLCADFADPASWVGVVA